MSDAFISYRRRPSASLSQLLKRDLKARYGIEAYLDVTRADSTQVQFPERLMAAIAESPTFICLLAETTLESEWVRKEIQQAYEHRCKCIPVFQQSYTPSAINDPAINYLLSFDGVKVYDIDNTFLDESIRDIAALVKRRPRPIPRLAWALMALLALILLGGGLFLALGNGGDDPRPTPPTQTRIAQVSSATPTPILSPERARALALTGVSRNADWIPYMEPDAKGVNTALVPAGSFTMGSTEAQIEAAFQMCQAAADNGATCERAWFDDEGPAHTQDVAAFWIDQTEVSRAMYAECVADGACTETPASDFSTARDQPINRITWFQARDYCEWRGGRLPSEAEWEYAARGPDGLIFPWGDEFIGEAANHCDGNCAEADWSYSYNYVNEENDDGHAVTAPVGEYAEFASWVGTLNQAGNVWEWTNSLYLGYPYSREQESNNADNSSDVRSLRGGSFNNPTLNLRASYRFNDSLPSLEADSVGFRCSRSY